MRTLSMAREVEQAQQNNMAIHIRHSEAPKLYDNPLSYLRPSQIQVPVKNRYIAGRADVLFPMWRK